MFDGDWLETGDLAYLAGGDLFITDRSKDIIIRAGRPGGHPRHSLDPARRAVVSAARAHHGDDREAVAPSGATLADAARLRDAVRAALLRLCGEPDLELR